MDRNFQVLFRQSTQKASLSARRAWIEIPATLDSGALPGVALRKESVDRNMVIPPLVLFVWVSLSARRAWIEIECAASGY